MSSSSAKTFRSPARKMACVSATITRTNWPLPPSSPAPKFSSTLTGMVAIQFPCAYTRCALNSLEMVFVDHYAHTAPASIFKAAHHATAAVNLHILARAHHVGRQQNRKVHHRSHRHVAIHRKQNAVGRDVLGLRRIRAALTLN